MVEGVCCGGGCVLWWRVYVVFVDVVLIHWSAIAQGTEQMFPRYLDTTDGMVSFTSSAVE